MTFESMSRRGLVLAALVVFTPRALRAQQGHEGAPETFSLQAVRGCGLSVVLVIME